MLTCRGTLGKSLLSGHQVPDERWTDSAPLHILGAFLQAVLFVFSETDCHRPPPPSQYESLLQPKKSESERVEGILGIRQAG